MNNHKLTQPQTQDSTLDSDSESIPDSIPSLDSIAKFAAMAAPDDSQTILYFALQAEARRLLPDERVAKCLRWFAPHSGGGVDVMHSAVRMRARYANLIVCGMIWSCIICARRITEHKRKELQIAVDHPGFKPFLITYTVRHNQRDQLADLTRGLLEALRRMKSHRAYKNITAEYAFAASVRGLEVTHGNYIANPSHSGWHPHSHDLIWIPKEIGEYVSVDGLRGELFPIYAAALERQGYSALEVAMDIRAGNEQIGDYVSKWGLAHEVAKAPVKMANNEGFTPFQLLWQSYEGDELAGRLFQEYYRVFKGRHALQWSRGSRALFGLGQEKTDDEIADSPLADDERLLAHLTDNQWDVIRRTRGKWGDHRGRVLSIAHSGDVDLFWRYLHAIGVQDEISVNATDLMWSEYEKLYGSRRHETTN